MVNNYIFKEVPRLKLPGI